MKKIIALFLLIALIKNANCQTPDWLWAESSGGGNYEYGQAISASPSGDIYMAGRMAGTITFGGLSLTTTGAGTTFKGKFDNNGNAKWLQNDLFSGGLDYVIGFTRDINNNTYSTGTLNSGQAIFVDKYNSIGTLAWKITINGLGGGAGLTVDDTGNVLVTGSYSGSLTIGPDMLPANGGNAMFLAKLDSNGNAKWAINNTGATSNVYATGIVQDKEGNIYVGGGYTGAPVFGNDTLPSTGGNTNLFIAEYDKSGNLLRITTATNAGPNDIVGANFSMAIDSNANLYIGSAFASTAQFGSQSITSAGGQDIFVAKCLNNGQWEWVQSAGGTGSDGASGIALGKNNDVYVTGNFSGTAQFGSIPETGTGSSNAFVAKYANSTGDIQWVQIADGGYADGITIDKQGYVYVTGDFGGTATFGASSLSATSTSNVFIAKLDTTPPRQIDVITAASYCPGSTAQLTYSVVGTFNAGNVFTAQLSDSTGSFISAVNIGDTTDMISGNIIITIPPNTPVGTNYLIRVISSNPAYSSLPGYFIQIGGPSINLKVSNDTSICAGSFVQLHATGATSYSWSPSATLNDSTSANPYSAPTVSTTYTITGSIGGCGNSTAMVVITVAPSSNISVSPSDTAVCSGVPVVMNAVGAPSYNWMPAVGLNCSTCANVVATPPVTTTYIVTGGGCSNADTVVIKVANTAIGGIVAAVNDTICSGFYTTLTLFGHSQGSAIQWQSSINDTDYVNVIGANDSTYNTGPLSRTHWYQAIVGSGNCSATSDTLKIYVPPAPIASFTATTEGELVFFNADASTNANFFSWNFGDNSSGSQVDTSHIYASPGNYHVCLIVRSDNGDCQDSICHDVSVSPGTSCQAYFSLYPDPNIDHHWFALNQSIGKNPIQYTWNWGDGNSSTGDTASHIYAAEGYYKICLTINDDTTCTSMYCDSSVYLYRMDGENAMVKVNVVSSLPNAVATVVQQKNNLVIFPNPCTTCQIKDADEAKNFIVTDLLGRMMEVSFVKSSGGYTLDFADNRTGMFLLKNIKTGEVVKFVRE